MRAINIPVGLKFEIQELQPIPSRESIEYNEESKKLIIDRINHFKKDFKDKLKVQSNNEVDLKTYIELKSIDDYDLIFQLNDNQKYHLNLYDIDAKKVVDNVKYFNQLSYYNIKDLNTYTNFLKINKHYAGYNNNLSNVNLTVSLKYLSQVSNKRT